MEMFVSCWIDAGATPTGRSAILHAANKRKHLGISVSGVRRVPAVTQDLHVQADTPHLENSGKGGKGGIFTFTKMKPSRKMRARKKILMPKPT